MWTRLATLIVVFSMTGLARGADAPLAKLPSYPIALNATDVREFDNLELTLNGLRIETGPVAVVPISCEVGVTGAVLIGQGSFRYAEGDDPLEVQFRAVVLRFSPKQWETLFSLDKSKTVTDAGAVELSRHLLKTVMGRCWHRAEDALIPTEGTLEASIFSKEHGDLFIATGATTATIYNFRTKQKLFEKK